MILPKKRDPRFITLRHGGTLQNADHHLLANWAADCAQHVLPFFERSNPTMTDRGVPLNWPGRGRGEKSR